MLRLVVSELRSQWTTWVGLFILVLVSSSCTGISVLSFVRTLDPEVPLDTAREARGGAILLSVFTVTTSLAVLKPVSILTVNLQRRRLAAILMAGAIPRQLGLAIALQIVCVTGLASFLGAFVAHPAQVLFGKTFTNVLLDNLGTNFRPQVLIWLPLITVAITLLGARKSILNATQTSPLEILRDPEIHHSKTSKLQWCLKIAYTLTIIAFGVGALNGQMECLFVFAIFMPTVVASYGNEIYPLAIRLASSIIPTHISPAWFLARHRAADRVSKSTAIITPFMLASGISASVYSMALILLSGMKGTNGSDNLMSVLFLVLVICVFGAACVVFMSNTESGRDASVAESAGADHETLLRVSFYETVIYCLSASGLSFICTALVGLVSYFVTLAKYGNATYLLDLLVFSVVTSAGVVTIAAATVVPLLTTLRRPLMQRMHTD